MMKKLLYSFSFALCATLAFAQNQLADNPAQAATDKMAYMYNLDEKQKSEMLKIEERKFRNLSEIEPLKATDGNLYVKKVRAMTQAHENSLRRLFNVDQLKMLQQHLAEVRRKKAEVHKNMTQAKATPPEIQWKLTELDIASMQ